jgi:guanylate kinase
MVSAQNVEFKARFNSETTIEELAARTGATARPPRRQTDTYFTTTRGRLKLRESDQDTELIYYERLNSATVRESRYVRTPLTGAVSGLKTLLSAALGTCVAVSKTRTVLAIDGSLVNIDVVDGLGRFVEVEISAAPEKTLQSSMTEASRLQRALGIEVGDFVPFSYADLIVMNDVAQQQRRALSNVERPGRLFLLDGPSGSGKTSILQAILQDRSIDLVSAPRHTTRSRRIGANEPEYIFVSAAEFHALVSAGAFMEFRDFDFGMSYGLSWQQAVVPLRSGANCIGIMDLGNVRHVAELFPEAVRVLVDAPLSTIERRLRARGHNTQEQIDERLGNARLIDAYRPYYHHIINNDDGLFDASVAQLRRIVSKVSLTTPGR